MKSKPDMRKKGSRLILFSVIAYPVLLILFFKLVFPLIYKSGDSYLNYYILTAVTLVSVIPFLLGTAVVSDHGERLAGMFGSGSGKNASWISAKALKWSSFFAVISFGILLPVIYLADAVPSEGWLRSIFAAMMLGCMTPMVIMWLYLVKRSSGNQVKVLLLFLLLITTVPLGLILHHPWNYFLFFSPLYWISWSWIISSPSESLLYGMIGLVILAAIMIASFRRLRKIL